MAGGGVPTIYSRAYICSISEIAKIYLCSASWTTQFLHSPNFNPLLLLGPTYNYWPLPCYTFNGTLLIPPPLGIHYDWSTGSLAQILNMERLTHQKSPDTLVTSTVNSICTILEGINFSRIHLLPASKFSCANKTKLKFKLRAGWSDRLENYILSCSKR